MPVAPIAQDKLPIIFNPGLLVGISLFLILLVGGIYDLFCPMIRVVKNPKYMKDAQTARYKNKKDKEKKSQRNKQTKKAKYPSPRVEQDDTPTIQQSNYEPDPNKVVSHTKVLPPIKIHNNENISEEINNSKRLQPIIESSEYDYTDDSIEVIPTSRHGAPTSRSIKTKPREKTRLISESDSDVVISPNEL